MNAEVLIYIFIMAGVTYLVRVLPITLIRKQIKNRFLKSFLYYVPYVTLSLMTFPAILYATQSPISGAIALIVGVGLAWFGASLFKVAIASCSVVFIAELVMKYLIR